tara:strand:- start:77 stop:439 length:363 start_codon:yes stop_codon:yes gene_type:complete
MKQCDTYWAKIYLGLNPGYEKVTDGLINSRKNRVIDYCKSYCDDIGLCVTIDDTEFIYTKGHEKGLVIGLINYPRFPKSRTQIDIYAVNLATALKELCQQNRVSIMYPDKTIMLENDEEV